MKEVLDVPNWPVPESSLFEEVVFLRQLVLLLRQENAELREEIRSNVQNKVGVRCEIQSTHQEVIGQSTKS